MKSANRRITHPSLLSWRPANLLLASILVVGVIGVGVIGIFITRHVTQSSAPFQAQSLETVPVDVSWAESYSSMSELTSSSSIVVDGTVSGVADTSVASHGMPFTDFALKVNKVLGGSQAASLPNTVRIHQTGGVSGNHLFEVLDDPLFEPGEHVILFLTEYSPSHYRVLGGPQGRFEVRNGMVVPLKDRVPSLAASYAYDDFVRQIPRP